MIDIDTNVLGFLNDLADDLKAWLKIRRHLATRGQWIKGGSRVIRIECRRESMLQYYLKELLAKGVKKNKRRYIHKYRRV